MIVHSFSIDGFPHLVEVFEAQGADKVVLRKVVRGKWVEILRSEFTPCATHAGDLLRELARLAALGREQGRADALREKVNILPGAKAIIERAEARIAALEAATRKIIEERDRWKNNYRAENHDLITARERIIELEQTDRDSRAEVADLSRRLEAQKARAETADFERDSWKLAHERLAADSRFYREDARKSGDQLAVLEGELVAAKTAAAGRARTEGGGFEMTAVYDGGNGGGYEPHVRLYVRRGDRIYILAEDRGRYDRQTGAEFSPPNREWVQLPPLPPIEPVKAGAEECEADPLGLARHDWHTHRGHVSCERCGAPFSEVRKDQACGAQP